MANGIREGWTKLSYNRNKGQSSVTGNITDVISYPCFPRQTLGDSSPSVVDGKGIFKEDEEIT